MSGVLVFNNPVESALRSLVLLFEAYPGTLDLQKLIYLDYLLVHSGDAGGPESLHPPTPHRGGEVVVRRELIQRGLNLLLVRGLAERRSSSSGFEYAGLDLAGGVISSLSDRYSEQLKARAQWVTRTFGNRSVESLSAYFNENLGRWGGEFALTSPAAEDEL